jgi:hypothetical protein
MRRSNRGGILDRRFEPLLTTKSSTAVQVYFRWGAGWTPIVADRARCRGRYINVLDCGRAPRRWNGVRNLHSRAALYRNIGGSADACGVDHIRGKREWIGD